MRKTTYILLMLLCIAPFLNITAVIDNNDTEIPTLSKDSEKFDDSLVILMSNLMNNFPQYTDEEYRQRLQELSGQIDYRLDPLVKERILIRTETYRASTENLLGRSDIYFPIFEEHLAKYNIPHHLKYLSIIESHLNPIAKSVASAVGLWQFIPSSGKMFGLEINNYVDERSDTYKASEAAAKLLNVLFVKYNDWALAMAAYNCGAGRVDNAIKAAKSNDYWVVRNYLPKETQKYVPFFMAMVYVGEFYESHDLIPSKVPQDLVLTDTIHMTGGISMFDLAKDLELSIDTLKFLNPSYRRNYIPQSPNGQIIVLPARIVSQMRGYQTALNRAHSIQKNNPIRAVRRISNEKDLQWLCKAHRCSIEDLLYWNELPADYTAQEGDLIVLRKHTISSNPIVARKRSTIEIIAIPSFKVMGIDAANNKENTTSVYMKPGKFNDGIAQTPGMEQTVKASGRYRIQSNDPAVTKEAGSVFVPKAGSYETQNVQPLNAAAGNALVPKKEAVAVKSVRIEDIGYPIESSYTDTKAEKASYNLEENVSVPVGNSLIPTDMQKKIQPVAAEKTAPVTTETETALDRSRARNIRGGSETPNR